MPQVLWRCRGGSLRRLFNSLTSSLCAIAFASIQLNLLHPHRSVISSVCCTCSSVPIERLLMQRDGGRHDAPITAATCSQQAPFSYTSICYDRATLLVPNGQVTACTTQSTHCWNRHARSCMSPSSPAAASKYSQLLYHNGIEHLPMF